VTKKKVDVKAVRVGKASRSRSGGEPRATVSVNDDTEGRTAAAAPPDSVRARKPRVRAQPPRGPAAATIDAAAVERGLEALREELRGLKERVVQQTVSTPSVSTDTPRVRGGTDTALEGAVDSLRRLLSELIEQHTESVVKELAEVRREAAATAGAGRARILDRVDHLLDTLGAVRFEAEPMDLLDPLIHVVAEERHDQRAPDGVILATLRPGYRTGRGLVVCKAGVAVNRRS
jgi:hypothetical protein